jgi:hypothetical protein
LNERDENYHENDGKSDQFTTNRLECENQGIDKAIEAEQFQVSNCAQKARSGEEPG